VYPNERTDFRETPIYRDSLLFFLPRSPAAPTVLMETGGCRYVCSKALVAPRVENANCRYSRIRSRLYRVRFPSRENCFTAGELSPSAPDAPCWAPLVASRFQNNYYCGSADEARDEAIEQRVRDRLRVFPSSRRIVSTLSNFLSTFAREEMWKDAWRFHRISSQKIAG